MCSSIVCYLGFCLKKPPPPWNVLFFGSDQFALRTLSLLQDAKSNGLVEHLEVVCGPDSNPVKGKSVGPVRSFAMRQHLKLHEVSSSSIKKWECPILPNGVNFDIGVVASFGCFIPARVISAFQYGGINAHPSLLPRHRGAAPLHHTLLCDDKIGGVSIIELHKSKFDAGKILYQQSVPITPEIAYSALLEKLSQLAAESVLHVLRNFDELSVCAKIQPAEGVTHATKIDSNAGKIKWSVHTSQHVWILWRALADTVGVFTSIQVGNSKLRVKLTQILPPHSTPIPPDLPPLDSVPCGQLVPLKETLWVKCKDNWLGITSLHTQEKRNIPAYDWINGYKIGKPNFPNSFVDDSS